MNKNKDNFNEKDQLKKELIKSQKKTFVGSEGNVIIYLESVRYEDLLSQKQNAANARNGRKWTFTFNVVNTGEEEVTVQLKEPWINCETPEHYMCSITVKALSEGFGTAEIYTSYAMEEINLVELDFILVHGDIMDINHKLGRIVYRKVFDGFEPSEREGFNIVDIINSPSYKTLIWNGMPFEKKADIKGEIETVISNLVRQRDDYFADKRQEK